jgi:hypothetical protein
MFTQLFGLNLATPSLWRYVFLISFGLSGLQILTSPAIVESPAFLSRRKLHLKNKRSPSEDSGEAVFLPTLVRT